MQKDFTPSEATDGRDASDGDARVIFKLRLRESVIGPGLAIGIRRSLGPTGAGGVVELWWWPGGTVDGGLILDGRIMQGCRFNLQDRKGDGRLVPRAWDPCLRVLFLQATLYASVVFADSMMIDTTPRRAWRH